MGLFISLLSFYILMLSIFLLLQKNSVKLENLLLTGYSPRQVALPYWLLTLGLNSCVLLLSLCGVVWVRGCYLGSLKQLFPQLESSSILLTLVAGIVLCLFVSLLNVVAIRRKVNQIWRKR